MVQESKHLCKIQTEVLILRNDTFLGDSKSCLNDLHWEKKMRKIQSLPLETNFTKLTQKKKKYIRNLTIFNNKIQYNTVLGR